MRARAFATGTGHRAVEWWRSEESHPACTIASADFDADGRHDLAVGSCGGANYVYHSDGEYLYADWAAYADESTTTIAWADEDGDGDLDLAVGGTAQPLRVYDYEQCWDEEAEETVDWFELEWSSEETFNATSVAWADADGDGDPDIAVGTAGGQPALLYRNRQHDYDLEWASPELDDTAAVAWIDVDDDGDEDLSVGNNGAPSRVYRNDGGELTLAWSSSEVEPVSDIATSVAAGSDVAPRRDQREFPGRL